VGGVHRVYGDPQKIVEEIASEILDKLDRMYRELEENVKRDLEVQVGRKVSELRARIDEGIKRYRGAVESARSKAEVEMKKAAEQRREEWINRVVEEVKDMFARELTRDEGLYKKFLHRSLETVLAFENEVHIETNKDTLELIEEVVKELKASNRVKSLSGELKTAGGFIAYSKDRSIRYNYTLEHVVESSMYELKVRVSRILFG